MITAPTNVAGLAKDSTQLSLSQGLAYALPTMTVSFLFGPITILQGIYATYFGVALSTIAAVLLISRLFDAVIDPLIGYFSDQYFARWGSRKPFVISGGVLFIFSSYFLYVPPINVSMSYFLGWSLVFYLAYTLFEIPHLAWGGELVDDSQEKNRIFGLRTFGVFFGSLLFFAMPLLPFFETSDFTPQTLKWSVLVAGLMMLPLLYLCFKHVPDPQKVKTFENNRDSRKKKKESLILVLRDIFANKPFLILTVAHIFSGFGSGMWFILLFLFVDTYLDLGHQFAMVYVISFSVSILTLTLWYKAAIHMGKQFVWMLGMALVVSGLFGTGLLSPDKDGWILLLICMTLMYSGFAAFGIIVPSLLSDIIDYGTWKGGSDRGATYFSLYTLLNKTVGAVGGALGVAIASWYGFDPIIITHSHEAIFGLRLAIAWIPALIILLSMFFIARIPITARRHAIIRRRLDARTNVRSARLN